MSLTRARYRLTPDTLGDGQWSDLLLDSSGNLKTTGTVSAIVPGTSASSLGKAEDSQHVTGDTGVAIWAVRNDTEVQLAGAHLDYSPIAVDNAGRLKESPFSVLRVTADGQIKGSSGVVHSISIAPTVAAPTAGLLTVYDSLTETGTILYSEWVFATTPGHTILLDAIFGTGLYVGYDGTLANVSVTATYR